MTELYAALQPVLDEHESFHKQQAQEDEEGKERAVQLAIMGLPNVVTFLFLTLAFLFLCHLLHPSICNSSAVMDWQRPLIMWFTCHA